MVSKVRTPVHTDSSVMVIGEGYERVRIVQDADTKRLLMGHVRVDRFRDASFARGYVWMGGSWIAVAYHPSVAWWADLPSYTRANQPRAHTRTASLVDLMITKAAIALQMVDGVAGV